MSNPFQYRQPLADRAGFYNRTSEIMRISSRIAADRPQSVSVVGELRVGKTSLLNFFRDPATHSEVFERPRDYVLLFLHLAEEPPADPAALFAQISRQWELQGGQPLSPGADGFAELVRDLETASRKLVLFLDDFGLVTQNSAFPLGFFSFMRSLANSSDVAYVTTSATDLQKLCHTPDIEESPFFNIFTTVHLEPFREQEARNMLQDLCHQGGQGCGAELDWAMALAGGSPYLLQLAGSVAHEARTAGRLGEEGLNDEAFREASDYLKELWSLLSPVEQEVLRSVVAGKPVDRRQEYAADSLVRRGHLVKEGERYQPRASLLARYVQECGRGGLWRRLFG